MTDRTALITGATAGIGAAFARRLAADGYDLVLVSRDGARLGDLAGQLAERHDVAAVSLPADLSTAEGCALVAARLADPDRPIDLLVNNAGIGLAKPVLRTSLADEERLLAINVAAVLRLTYAALSVMVNRRSGAIINVSSVAAFGPTSPGSTYPASKAWVNSFSESMAQYARRRGVRVMALCPGFTRTEFHRRAGIDVSKMPEWAWLDADEVVGAALRDLRRGRVVSVPSWKYKMLTGTLRHLPRSLHGWLVTRGMRSLGRETPRRSDT